MKNLSVDQAFLRAKSHIKKNEIEEAKKLYQAVLLAFPKNIRAQKELAYLSNHEREDPARTQFEDTLKQLINLYNHGQFEAVI